MPSDKKFKERNSKRAVRGAGRAAAKEVRKERRTERLAARKGISTDQASQLQANRKQRFKEFASGGTENITTGRLRFGDGDGGVAGSAATGGGSASDTSSDQNAKLQAQNVANKQLTQDRLGGAQDELTGRGGSVYNRGAGSTGSVEVGNVKIGDAGFSDETLTDSGYTSKSRGGGAYRA